MDIFTETYLKILNEDNNKNNVKLKYNVTIEENYKDLDAWTNQLDKEEAENIKSKKNKNKESLSASIERKIKRSCDTIQRLFKKNESQTIDQQLNSLKETLNQMIDLLYKSKIDFNKNSESSKDKETNKEDGIDVNVEPNDNKKEPSSNEENVSIKPGETKKVKINNPDEDFGDE